MKPLNVADYRRLAKKRLPRGMFEYIDRGTVDEVGLRGIRNALDATKLCQTDRSPLGLLAQALRPESSPPPSPAIETLQDLSMQDRPR